MVDSSTWAHDGAGNESPLNHSDADGIRLKVGDNVPAIWIRSRFQVILPKLAGGQQRAQAPGPFWSPELPKRFGFDLPDAFACYVELLADLFERVLAFAADAEAEPDHLFLFGRQGLEDTGSLVPDIGLDDRVDRRPDPAILDQIAQSRFAVATDRRFERHRVARDGLELLDLLDRDIHAAADLFVGGSAAHFLLKLTGRAKELVHALVHVDRDADGAGLIGDGASDRLANPPGRIRRKLVAAAVLELVGRAHEADIAFLDQIEQVQTAVDVLLGDRHHKAKVRLDQVFLGPFGFLFAVPDHHQGVLEFFDRSAGGDFALADFTLQFANTNLHGNGIFSFELLQFAIEVVQFLDSALDFAGEIPPAEQNPGHAADGERSLDRSPV